MARSTVDQLATLFRETGAAHHTAFAATNGEDPDWPVWYAEYLAPRIARLLGRHYDEVTLAADLRRLDEQHRQSGGSSSWPEYYARWFIDRAAV